MALLLFRVTGMSFWGLRDVRSKASCSASVMEDMADAVLGVALDEGRRLW